MKEYIERDAALAAVCIGCCECDVENPFACEGCAERTEMLKIPSADVAPVVHGEWLGRHGDGGYDDYYCSVCGMYEEGTRNPKLLGNYCSNCGAKMDGGKQDVKNKKC